jgi:hypothetical protein
MSHEITLVDRRPKPLAVVGIETTSSHAKTRIAPAVIDNVGRSVFKIALHTAEDMPPGRHEEQLVIYTNDSLYREIRVPFVVIKEATRRIRAMPSEVTLNAPRMVRLRDDQNQPIHIESLAADHPAISSQWAPGPENQATIKLALDSAQTPGSGGTASVRVQISSPVREMLVIPVRWEGN